MRSYYSIWDDENSQIAFLPHLESNATVTVAPLPTEIIGIQAESVPFSYVNALVSLGSTYISAGALACGIFLVFAEPVIAVRFPNFSLTEFLS